MNERIRRLRDESFDTHLSLIHIYVAFRRFGDLDRADVVRKFCGDHYRDDVCLVFRRLRHREHLSRGHRFAGPVKAGDPLALFGNGKEFVGEFYHGFAGRVGEVYHEAGKSGACLLYTSRCV